MAASLRSFPLTGADYFVWALDRQMRRAGLSGNVCRMVVRLEGPVDEVRLRARLAGSPILGQLARLRLVRPLPLLSPRWRPVGGELPELLRVHPAPAGSDPGLVPALPAADLRPGVAPVLGFDLVRRSQGGDLVLSWHHALMDVRGADLLLRHLGRAAPSAAGPAGAFGDPGAAALPALRRWGSYPRRVGFARGSLAFITTTCREPLFSLVPAGSPAAGASNTYRVHWFTPDETSRVDEHGRRLDAGFRRSQFYLAASVRALHAVAAKRGDAVGAYVVPVPHDLRRRGAEGPILSNQLSFLFFRIEAAQTGSLAGMVCELTRQMMDQARGGNPESFRAAMELFRPAPLDFYVRQVGRPTRGRLATFFFSDAGESCPGLDRLAGAVPTAVTHLAPASCPPGLTVVFSRFRGRLCFVLSWIDGCLTAREVDELERAVCTALLEGDGA
ncbi:MAG: hypothetical protein HZB55_15765 [Deltaproteobacteria bacterium]|nr:hypothetical protein [Deltaproteobacteria bacterium]